MHNLNQVINLLSNHFPFEPTNDQKKMIEQLALFLLDDREQSCFVLTGYAGTGKTSSMISLIKTLPILNIGYELLAPTGRAAKVLSNYTHRPASTIHRKIFKKANTAEGNVKFLLGHNTHKNTLFIVDEASMISATSADWSGQSILDDLLQFVQSGYKCKLLLIGDEAQLPPVGSNTSPALDIDFLSKNYFLKLYGAKLKEVVRQKQSSGILYTATDLRLHLFQDEFKKPEIDTAFLDVHSCAGLDLTDVMNDCYRNNGQDEVIILCRSNKRANLYNQQVRARIHFFEEELSAGDRLMAVKNNYTLLPDTSNAGFIANGELIQVLKVYKTVEMYEMRFAEIIFKLVDYPDEQEYRTFVLLDTLYSETPSLSQEQQKKFYYQVAEDYAHLENKTKRADAIRNDKYYSALQVKFAYAVTCHKAQGGQWACVLIDKGFLPEDQMNREYLRWLYTAVTRASKEIYFIGFDDMEKKNEGSISNYQE